MSDHTIVIQKATTAQWADRICVQVGKSVESIIEVGRLLIQAKADLAHGEWGRLFDEKLIPFSQQTANKLMAVASHPQMSNPAHVRNLPPSWGTLYELTKIPEPTLQHALADGRITPDMPRKAVQALAGPDVELVPANKVLYAEDSVDGRTRRCFIHPFTDPAFVFYNVMIETPDGGATLDGGKRAIRRDVVFLALQRGEGFPAGDVTWQIEDAERPWSYNELMFDSHEDYVQQMLLAAGTFIDSPYIATSPEEHDEYIRSAREVPRG